MSVEVIFESDETAPSFVTESEVTINIIDDNIDEAPEEFFVATIMVQRSVSMSSVLLQPIRSTVCSIVDNDRKFFIIICMTYSPFIGIVILCHGL